MGDAFKCLFCLLFLQNIFQLRGYALSISTNRAIASTRTPSSSSTTFKICDKLPEKFNGSINDGKHVAKYLKQYEKNNLTHIIKGSDFRGVYPIATNGFVDTVIESYGSHHNLAIRPDDIWTAIIVQFSYYVNANSEQFRNQFVNFKGKKELAVSVGGSLFSAPYDYLVKLMTKEIHKNLIDDEVKNWILPNFTTTTEDDFVTNGVVFMATMKNYFHYRFDLLCGIPSVTLLGTVEDWKNIRNRLQKFEDYGLEDWVNLLEPIIDQFIRAKSGNADIDFWTQIVHKIPSVGCGGPPDISGWITAFCVFDDQGKWQGHVKSGMEWPTIGTEDIPPGVVEVNVKINDNGREYNSVMIAGHMGNSVLNDGYTLQPKSGWVIALKED